MPVYIKKKLYYPFPRPTPVVTGRSKHIFITPYGYLPNIITTLAFTVAEKSVRTDYMLEVY